jgi:predicted AAA+ superfamily ATPase
MGIRWSVDHGRGSSSKAYYWRTQAGAELDLLLFLSGRRIGIEIKRADAPKMTPSMGSVLTSSLDDG